MALNLGKKPSPSSHLSIAQKEKKILGLYQFISKK